MRKLLILLPLLLVFTVGISAQTIEGKVLDANKGMFDYKFEIHGIKGETYRVELWVAPSGSEDYRHIPDLPGKWGPGLDYDAARKSSFGIEHIPPEITGKVQFRFKLIPDRMEIWSKPSVVMLPKDSAAFTADWFGLDLMKNGDFTFGVMAVETYENKAALRFMMTDLRGSQTTVTWDNAHGATFEIETNSGMIPPRETGEVIFDGKAVSRVVIPPNGSIEALLVIPVRYDRLRSIHSGSFDFRAIFADQRVEFDFIGK